MNHEYNYRNCQSLFGYARGVHRRSGGICQLCGAGKGEPINFDLWRQLTVEHLVGASQGGYINDIRKTFGKRFPSLSNQRSEELALRIDSANTVTACHFCNSTTSRYQNTANMTQLILEAEGEADDVVAQVESKLKEILRLKQNEVRFKLDSIWREFNKTVKPEFDNHPDRNPAFK